MVKPPLRLLGLVLVLAAAVDMIVVAQRDTSDGRPAIRLRGATFTPSRGERPDIPPGLAAERPASGRAGYYLVQFQGPILDSWKQAVSATGAEIIEYVPDFAFKVRMTREQANRVSRLTSVIWVDDFQPAYKLGGLAPSNGQRAYFVRVERGVDAAAVASAVAGTGAQVLGRNGSIITAFADAARLAAIARIVDVAGIENFQLRQKHSEYAGGVIMGADAAHAAGFDGSSQTIALADTGLGGGTILSAHVDLPAPRLTAIFNWPGAAGGCFSSVSNDGAVDVGTGARYSHDVVCRGCRRSSRARAVAPRRLPASPSRPLRTGPCLRLSAACSITSVLAITSSAFPGICVRSSNRHTTPAHEFIQTHGVRTPSAPTPRTARRSTTSSGLIAI